MRPLILDLSKYELGSGRIRLQDYAIWSGSPDSPRGVVRYHIDGQQRLSANRANRDKRVFFDRTGEPQIDEFFRNSRDAIFDAVTVELRKLRLKSVVRLSTSLPPKPSAVLLRRL